MITSDQSPSPLPPLLPADGGALPFAAQPPVPAPEPTTRTVGELAAEASALIERLPGPLSRVRLALGPAEVEVEWAAPAPQPVAVPAPVAYPAPPAPPTAPAAPVQPAPVQAAPVQTVAATPAPADGRTAIVEAPLVGVLYRGPSPDEPPFVEVGTRVEAGTQVAIIEAMKLMNSVQSEVAGVVTAVLVESGTSVEFGQPLFEIRQDE